MKCTSCNALTRSAFACVCVCTSCVHTRRHEVHYVRANHNIRCYFIVRTRIIYCTITFFQSGRLIFFSNSDSDCMVRTHVQSILHEMHLQHAYNALRVSAFYISAFHACCNALTWNAHMNMHLHEVHCMRERVVKHLHEMHVYNFPRIYFVRVAREYPTWHAMRIKCTLCLRVMHLHKMHFVLRGNISDAKTRT